MSGETDKPESAKSESISVIARLLAGPEPWSWTWRYHPSLYDHMHALGVVTANYNHLEFIMLLMFSHYMRGESASVTTFTHLNNRHRQDVLAALLKDQERDEKVKDLINHFCKGYDICAENRNFLMHSLTKDGAAEQPHNTARLTLAKAARTEPTRVNYVQLSVEDLRRLADEIDAYDRFGVETLLWLASRPSGRFLNAEGKEITPKWPKKPPELSKLSLSPDPS